MEQYLNDLYDRLLENRYQYYVLADPVLEDWLYDWIERYYNDLALKHGSKIMDMVDFDLKCPRAQAAAKRVDAKQDHHSLWELSMKPVWDKLGRHKYSPKVRKALYEFSFSKEVSNFS
jgi:NAD-dependent DNA ligase